MRLICFGDSWTGGHGVETDKQFKENANPPTFIRKLREQNSWVRWCADKLKVPFVNMGICGYGNVYIFNDLKESIESGYIEEDDFIIVMFSYPYRYKRTEKYDVVKLFWEFEELLKNHKRLYFNSFYPTFKEEQFDILSLPNCFINPNSCMSELLKKYEIKDGLDVWEYNKASVWNDEKNYWEGDYHPNLTGYKLIADYIYDEVKRRI
jgi:hypothetical protein